MTDKYYGKFITAVILCAGSGQRTGLAYNKVLHYIGAKTVLETAADKFEGIADSLLFVCSARDIDQVKEIAAAYPGASVVTGGSTRSESVRRALAAADKRTDIICIHDGARPYVTPAVIVRTIDSAAKKGCGIAAVPSVDAVKAAGGGKIMSLDKSTLYNTQTPQTFRYPEIVDAYNKISGDFGDDAEVYERAGYTLSLTEGDYANTKITTAEDLFKLPGNELKIGAGFDVHRCAEGRKLIVGGVDIPFTPGLMGHSDADVLTHAVMDAVLSAAGLPDIGVLFPDTDDCFKDADSIKLFEEVCCRMRNEGYEIRNISAVIMAQAPKMAGYIPLMREKLAGAAGIRQDMINISATTTEKLGIVGEEKGIAASCSCLLEKR